MYKYTVSLIVILLLVAGCSRTPNDNFNYQLWQEYDEGLNLTITTGNDFHEQLGRIEITFSLPSEGVYELIVYNATGYSVRSFNGTAEAGQISIMWDATNKDGKRIDPGIYIYELTTNNLAARRVIVFGGVQS